MTLPGLLTNSTIKKYFSESFYQTKLTFSESYCKILQTFSREIVPGNTSFCLIWEFIRWGTHVYMSHFFVCPSIWPLRTISQEPYIMWSKFLVHMCKMMISPGIFFILQNFDFSGCYEGKKGQKMTQEKKFCSSHSVSQVSLLIFVSTYSLYLW